jgi:hypothetical protein
VWDVVDVGSGASTRLGSCASGNGELSADGRWMLVNGVLPGTAEPRWHVFPVDRPTAVRLVSVGRAGARFTWAAPARPPAYLTRVRIAPPTGPVPLQTSYRLRLDGFSPTGARMPVPFAQWHAADAMIATVDTEGVLYPRRAGRVAIIASAGGWRADTLELEVAAGRFATILRETWEKGLEANWVPFGTPLPMVDPPSGAAAVLWTRGDSSFDSGVYSRVAVSARRGLGVQATISGALSAEQWQHHFIGVAADLDSTWLAHWDHRTGGLRVSGDPVSCFAHYPAAEGAKGSEHVAFGCAHEQRYTTAAPALGDGSWHVLRLQLFPDGRLGLAIDGKPASITTGSIRLDRPFRVVLTGQSVRARMVIDEVEFWTGVRGDIDWRVVR